MRLSWECTSTPKDVHIDRHTHRRTHPHPLSVTASLLRTWISLSSLLSSGLFLSLFNPKKCVWVQLGGKIISLLGECVISVTGRVTGQTIPLHRCSAWWALHKLWQRVKRQRGYSTRVLEVYSLHWGNALFSAPVDMCSTGTLSQGL